MREVKKYKIWEDATPVAVTSSTDATPIVVTATAHGFSTGDLVMINGHTTNVAANGIFKVTKVDANSFSLQDRYSGDDVAGSGAGAGSSGVVVIAPKILSTQDFRNVELSVITSSSSNQTLKISGSLGKPDEDKDGDTPNFGATQSDDNPYNFLQLVDLEDGSTVAGDTGIVTSGTDINNTYEININASKYVCPIITAWSAGSVTMVALLTDNE